MVGAMHSKKWWWRPSSTAGVVCGLFGAAFLSSCAPATHSGSRPTTPAPSTSTIPVAGTSFNETVTDANGTELVFPKPSPSIGELARSMASTVSSHRVLNGRVWLNPKGAIAVDLPGSTNNGPLARELSAIGRLRGDRLYRPYQFVEAEFAREGVPLTPGSMGVEVLTEAPETVNDEVLGNTGVEVVKALQSLGVTYLVIERVTVLAPSGFVWRVVAIGPTIQTRQQQIGHTVEVVLGNSPPGANSVVTKDLFVNGSITKST
jgi:hypothetical protein